MGGGYPGPGGDGCGRSCRRRVDLVGWASSVGVNVDGRVATFFFMGAQVVSGAQPLEIFQQIIAQEKAKAD